MKDLTREEALKFHKQMWSEMKEVFGDTPSTLDRRSFKYEWCLENFPNSYVHADCFLCDYVKNTYGRMRCECCPINWGPVKNVKFRCMDFAKEGNADYRRSPISEILALPEEPEEE